MVGAGVFFQSDLRVQDSLPAHRPFLLTVVTVGDVAGGAPEVADIRRPLPRLVLAPFAETEHDRPAGGVQCVAHRLVGFARIRGAVVAPVVFQIIDAPRGVQPGVLKFVTAPAGIAAAGFSAGAIVDAELEAPGVQKVAQRLQAAGKFRRIGNEIAVSVPLFGHPAIVEHDVGVTRVAHAARDQHLGGLVHQRLVDVRGKRVPGVPTHRRSRCQAGEFLGQRRGGEQQQQAQDSRQRMRQRILRWDKGLFSSAVIAPELRGVRLDGEGNPGARWSSCYASGGPDVNRTRVTERTAGVTIKHRHADSRMHLAAMRSPPSLAPV